MILSCPTCSARFNVAVSALEPNGRTVRCGRCGHAWFVGIDGEPAPPPLPALYKPRDADEIREDAAAARGGGRRRAAAAAEEPVPDLSALRKAASATRTDEPGRLRRAALWALFLAVVAAIAGALWWSDDVIATVPRTRGVYEALRLTQPPVPGEGLRIYAMPQRIVRDGIKFVIIEGEVRNHADRPRPVPEMRGSLRDKDGRELQVWRIALPSTVLRPSEVAIFRSEILDTSPDAIEATVAFVGPAGG